MWVAELCKYECELAYAYICFGLFTEDPLRPGISAYGTIRFSIVVFVQSSYRLISGMTGQRIPPLIRMSKSISGHLHHLLPASYNHKITCISFVAYGNFIAGSGYVDVGALATIAKATRSQYSSFGGIMLWDASQAYANGRFDVAIKSAIKNTSGGSSTTTTTSKTTTTSSTTKTTSTSSTTKTTSSTTVGTGNCASVPAWQANVAVRDLHSVAVMNSINRIYLCSMLVAVKFFTSKSTPRLVDSDTHTCHQRTSMDCQILESGGRSWRYFFSRLDVIRSCR